MVVVITWTVYERLELQFTYSVFYTYLSFSCMSCCLTPYINEMCVALGVARIKTPISYMMAIPIKPRLRQYMYADPNPLLPISYETNNRIEYDGVWLGAWLRRDKVMNGSPSMSVDYEFLTNKVKDVVMRNSAAWDLEHRILRLTPFTVVV